MTRFSWCYSWGRAPLFNIWKRRWEMLGNAIAIPFEHYISMHRGGFLALHCYWIFKVSFFIMGIFSCSLLYSFSYFAFLKVGLLGLGRSLQRDLDRIAETADTSTPEGLSYVLTGKDCHVLSIILPVSCFPSGA